MTLSIKQRLREFVTHKYVLQEILKEVPSPEIFFFILDSCTTSFNYFLKCHILSEAMPKMSILRIMLLTSVIACAPSLDHLCPVYYHHPV